MEAKLYTCVTAYVYLCLRLATVRSEVESPVNHQTIQVTLNTPHYIRPIPEVASYSAGSDDKATNEVPPVNKKFNVCSPNTSSPMNLTVSVSSPAAGAGPRGPEGAAGAAGEPGAQGATGPLGPRGPPGPPGPKGELGKIGPRGTTGRKGKKGDKGEKGENGDSASPRLQAAVSAIRTKHFGPAKNVILPFDTEVTDIADNYDNNTGVFISTIRGTYIISLYLMSQPSYKVNARIMVNDRPIAALWADDNNKAGFYPSSSIQTISKLEFGDQVYVKLVDSGYGDSWVHANYNIFTIFLLYEDLMI